MKQETIDRAVKKGFLAAEAWLTSKPRSTSPPTCPYHAGPLVRAWTSGLRARQMIEGFGPQVPVAPPQ